MGTAVTRAHDTGCRNRTSAFVGLDERTPLLGGRLSRYVNLDNAATTPPLRAVVSAVQEALVCYSSVHRGAGYKARASSAAYEDARQAVARFAGADARTNTVIFVKNTTEAINKLSARLPMPSDAVVLTTMMEHHSNDLPWRRRATVVRVRTTDDGQLDEDDFDRQLAAYTGRIAIVAVTAASNVTGFVQPIHRLARKAHAAGTRIFVDAAQFVAHRRLDIKGDADPEHIDFVAFSGHKMYAPFGTGALIGPKAVFLEGTPDHVGGGTVDMVTEDDVSWTSVPDRDEAGTPNALGAIALAAAARVLESWGFDALEQHETSLAEYARQCLRAIPGLTIYGDPEGGSAPDRVGVIPFNLPSADHALTAAVLGYEGGIGVRNGCFCAQIYVARLLGRRSEKDNASRARSDAIRPGMVRLSLGAYNTIDDIDAAIAMVRRVAQGDFEDTYHRVSDHEYAPAHGVPAVSAWGTLR
jgi:cysteine desulfurase/selenocysteine lyase